MREEPATPKLFALAWPIFLSQFIQTVIYTIDTLMLGRYSDLAVAAVGTVAQVMSAVHLVFGFVTIGTSILMSQLIGSGKREEAGRMAWIAIGSNLGLGVIVSASLLMGAGPILRAIGMPEELVPYGQTFLGITGAASVAAAFVMTAEMILRMNGMVKRMLLLSLAVVLVSTAGNYVVLYGPGGLPTFGVEGVAWSTFASRFVGVGLAVLLLAREASRVLPSSLAHAFRIRDLKKIFRLGIPSAGEHLSYSASQVVITMIVALLGTAALTTKIYTQSITSYVFLISISVGQATTIMIGYLLGAGGHAKAQAIGIRHLKIGLGLCVSLSVVLYLLAEPVIGLFTENAEVIAISRNLLLLSVLLEAARTCNVIMIAGLNASGDVKYPVVTGLILMWGVSVPAAYLFGIVLGYGIYGIWLAFILDEWIRGALMIRRWKLGKWKNISLLNHA